MPGLTPTFRDLPTFRLAGIRRFHDLPTAPATIPDQWHDLHASGLPGLAEATITYGATCQVDMPNQRLEYLAGYEVLDFENIPADARMIIPAAHYAVFELASVADIRPFWQQLFDQWLATSGYQPADAPNFERYDERFNPVTRGPFQIWIPLQR
jgi:AraC family transcriptional regulator